MQIFAGLSVAALVLVAAAVVIKTFALWLRTRGLPELLLSVYFTCATVVGYPLAIAMSLIPASENVGIHVTAELVMSLGWVALPLFTLNVFRPDATWARVLVGFCMLLVAVGAAAYLREVTGDAPRPPQEIPGLTLGLSVPIAIAYLWNTIESLGYYRQLKLRLKLGLTDVAVVNRVLLWGLMSLAAGVALVASMAALLAGAYMSPPVVLFSSVCGLVHAGCLYLAFHAPGWYQRWLEQGSPAAAA